MLLEQKLIMFRRTKYMKKLTALFLVLSLMLGLFGFVSADELPVQGQIIYGSDTELSGDWALGAIWTNNSSDKLVRDLTNDYFPSVYTKGGEVVVNPQVVDGEVKGVINEDGTKTFTVKIKEDLLWSDGSPITAEHYVAAILLFNHPTLKKLGSKALGSETLVGAKAYSDGTSEFMSGLRLLDKFTFSMTVLKEKIPYYFDLLYIRELPLPTQMWLGEGYEIKDDGKGAYITGDLTEEVLKPKVEKARYLTEGRVTAGPYKFVSYDKAAAQAVLEVDPNYKGTFDGVKPHVQKLIITKVVKATKFDMLKTGEIDLISQITDGDEVKTALDIVEKGEHTAVSYDRNGYGRLAFSCDFGPTQFVQVRKALAHVLNRIEFANTFTQGHGTLVHGPYGIASWMYKEAEEELSEKLNQYPYSFDEAKKLVEEAGFVLAKDGSAYTEGIRYKEVTPEEAGTYEHNVKLENGKVLMPLIIEWFGTSNNPVTELLSTMLAHNPDLEKIGAKILETTGDFPELINWLYRDGSVEAKYGVPKFGMFNLGTGFKPAYDMAYNYTTDPKLIAQGYNENRISDEELDKTSMDMVYGIEPGNKEGYLKKFVEFVLRYNEILPDIPLYSNVYYSVFAKKLENYEENPMWSFERSIVYANVK